MQAKQVSVSGYLGCVLAFRGVHTRRATQRQDSIRHPKEARKSQAG